MLVKQYGGAPKVSRRRLMSALAASAGAALFDTGPVLARLIAETGQGCGDERPLGRLVGSLPLSRPDGLVQPFGVKIGRPGLDARLNTDLSILQPDRLITPTDQAYVRTECPPAVLARRGAWTMKTTGLIARAGVLPPDDLTRRARSMGAHLFECSGNNNPANFGLMSVAEWEGVPLTDVIAALQPASSATAVLVSGVDPDQPSVTSTVGASWILPLASLDGLGAFLAVRMNGQPLPPDHGSPVRLAVPGWYGCAWIKWIDEVRLVDASEAATSQMKEFAGRTHQAAIYDLARDYAPPAIQTAATAVRVEKRIGTEGVEYRVVGIVWGGARPVDRLAIRFNDSERWQPFDICPAPTSSALWSLWSYRWKPAAPGTYSIALQVPDRSVPQRRLDSGYYVRQVRIEEV
jgi:DMSO/TMAO reductase YedYZ molybdopterin-dependent catalytic subunit